MGQLHRNQTINMLQRQQDCAEPSCGKTVFALHSFWTERINYVEWCFKNSSLKTLSFVHFTMDSFTNKAKFDTGFSERLKLKDNAVLAIMDPTALLQHASVSNSIYCVVNIALSVKQVVWYEYLWVLFLPKSLQLPSMRNMLCQIYTSQS